uniref:PRKCA-binding protein n=1 Tax=Caenorhabditis japonica TaxID=281687 RepID=A0A8R1DJS0_CAEJA
MSCVKGAWRLDLGLMVLYQMTLFFSVQMLFVIFLEYMPSTYCTDDDYCYKMKSKCLSDFERKSDSDICPFNGTNFKQCVSDAKEVDFHSAQFEYQQDCTGLKYFSSSTSTFLGTLVGNLVLGYLSDTFGRRPVYIASIIIGVPAVVLSAAINSVTYFYIFRFVVGFAVAGTLTVGWTYGSEMITPSRRFRLRTFPNWANARIMQVAVSWLAGEWRLASYMCAFLSASVLPMIWYLPESPVFLEQKQKYERAEKSRQKIADICQIERKSPTADVTPPKLKKVTAKKLWKSPVLRQSFLVLCFMWFYVGMSVYITDLNSGDMAKNFYVGQFLCGFVLTVSKIIIGIVEPKIPCLGRRVLFITSQILANTAYVTILIALWTHNKETWWYTLSYTIAFSAQSLCLETCYLSLAELMPTDVRTTAGAITNILMKVGTILASTTKPIKFWYEPLLFMINLVICTIGLVIVWKYLPESKNANIQLVGQDDVSDDEDDEEVGDKKKDTDTTKSKKDGSDEKTERTERTEKESKSVNETESRGGGPYCPCVYVVQVFDKSPAYKDGRIRCGDEIVAVNGITVKGERKSAVAQLIQVSLNPVKITINKLDDVNTKGKTLDILIKKAKHKVVEFMDQNSADALGLSRAILTNDILAEKEKILEENAEFYRQLVAFFGDMFQYQQKISECQKEFGSIFCDLAAHEKQQTANEAFTAFGDKHRMIAKIQAESAVPLQKMVSDLQVYLDHVVPDTRLTIKKYLDVKYEYLSYCLKLKEMDDEEGEFIAIQEPLYRVETGNYEYRMMLRCRQECRQRFIKMRDDVMVKIELLDQKHVRDIAQHLALFAKTMARCQIECANVLKEQIDVPIEIDLEQLNLSMSSSNGGLKGYVERAEEVMEDDPLEENLIDVAEPVSLPRSYEDTMEPLLGSESPTPELSLIDIS